MIVGPKHTRMHIMFVFILKLHFNFYEIKDHCNPRRRLDFDCAEATHSDFPMSFVLTTKLRSLFTPRLLRNLPSFGSINNGVALPRGPIPQFPKRNLNSLSVETEAEFIERLHSGFGGRTESDTPAEQEWNASPQSAEEIFSKMKETGLIPNAVAMLDALCNDGLGDEALKLIVLVRDEGMIPRVVIHTAAVEGFCKAHRFDDAIRVFKKMKIYGVPPNPVTYQILIRGLCIGKRLEDAFEYTVEMVEMGHRPNVATFTGLLDVYCKEKGLQDAKNLITTLKLKGFSMELKVVREYWNAKGPFSPLVMEAIMGIKD